MFAKLMSGQTLHLPSLKSIEILLHSPLLWEVCSRIALAVLEYFIMSNFTCILGLVAPTVMIKLEGDPTAGSSYTLVCQVTVTQGLVVNPDVVWLDSNGMTVSGLMDRPSIENNVVTRTFTFNPLRTIHGGMYTCHASISLPSISIANLSNNSSTRITVLSMLI